MTPESFRKALAYMASLVVAATSLAAVQGVAGEKSIAVLLLSFSVGVMVSIVLVWLNKPESYVVYLTPEQVADIQTRLNEAEGGSTEGTEEQASCVGFSMLQPEEEEETEEDDE